MDRAKIKQIINILAEDGDIILYRKSLRPICSSVTATILLQQIIWYAKQNGFQPFYKFRAPAPKHHLYREGDSWTERLGFSGKEFDAALSRIGTKITKGVSKSEVLNGTTPQCLVLYWTDASRVTWYQLNWELLGNLLLGNYLVVDQRGISRKSPKGELPINRESTEKPDTNTPASAGVRPPSTTDFESAFPRPNGQYAAPKTSLHDLPPDKLNETLLLRAGRASVDDPRLETAEREIIHSGWRTDRLKPNVYRALVTFWHVARDEGWQLPQSDGLRKAWVKEVKEQLEEFGAEVLEILYRAAFQKAREDGWTPSRPGSLTRAMLGIRNKHRRVEQEQEAGQFPAIAEVYGKWWREFGGNFDITDSAVEEYLDRIRFECSPQDAERYRREWEAVADSVRAALRAKKNVK